MYRAARPPRLDVLTSSRSPDPLVLRPEEASLAGYLEDTSLIDWQSPPVYECAREIVRDRAGNVDRARVLFEWVRDEIPHSFDIETDVLTCNAGRVLRERTGLCYAKSHLLAALLRANGIPAGFGYQRLRRDPPEKGFVLHGWNGVYLASLERWIALDPRGDNEAIATTFDLDTPSLAFAPDPELGEETCPIIFSRPHREVVEVLSRSGSLERARRHLPGDL